MQDCDSAGFPEVVPQLFKSVHVLVLVPLEGHEIVDQSGHCQLGLQGGGLHLPLVHP